MNEDALRHRIRVHLANRYHYSHSDFCTKLEGILAEHSIAQPAQVPAELSLNIIRKWPDGFQKRLDHVWKDVDGFIPNVKLYDLQRTLAEFGFTMKVYEQAAQPAQVPALEQVLLDTALLIKQQPELRTTFIEMWNSREFWNAQPDTSAKTWCEYVAGMIGCYLGEPVDSDKCKAIAAIIERRLWALPIQVPAQVPAWQDISTAPKDGSTVLLYGQWAGEINGVNTTASIDLGRWSNGTSDFPGTDWWQLITGDAYACWMKASHWMPLPELPAAPEVK